MKNVFSLLVLLILTSSLVSAQSNEEVLIKNVEEKNGKLYIKDSKDYLIISKLNRQVSGGNQTFFCGGQCPNGGPCQPSYSTKDGKIGCSCGCTPFMARNGHFSDSGPLYFVNLTKGIKFTTKTSSTNSIPFDISISSELENYLSDFINKNNLQTKSNIFIGKDGKLPKGYGFLIIDFFGYDVSIVAPINKIKNMNLVSVQAISCGCHMDNGSCTTQSSQGTCCNGQTWTVYRCAGGCSCAMTISGSHSTK